MSPSTCSHSGFTARLTASMSGGAVGQRQPVARPEVRREAAAAGAQLEQGGTLARRRGREAAEQVLGFLGVLARR